MGNGQVRPSYCNLVVLMDPTFVASYANAQEAKEKMLPNIEGAVMALNSIFGYYNFTFKVVFYPENYLIPSYLTYNSLDPWMDAIKAKFRNDYPCIQSDVIIALSNSFSSGGGFGTSGVATLSGSASSLAPYIICHEIGHNIGLSHQGITCEASCMPPTFMCESGGNLISFNECDYQRIADLKDGVFSRGVACLPCRCNIWADFVDVFPDNYICPVTPKVSITSDQPYLTLPSEGCVPDRSNSMIAVTVNGGENGVVNGRLRIRYQPTIYKWEELEGVDFDVSEDLPTNDPDYPTFKQLKNFISGSTDEYIFQLAPYEDITFYTKIKYMPAGGINPSSELPLRIKARLISSNSNQPITSILGPKYLQTASGSISFFNANQPYLVTGDLTLDLTQGVSMFTMPPLLLVKNGAKIKLPSANINGVYSSVNLVNNGKPGTIAGCNTMWQGFEVDELSKIEISNATVMDAQFAVNLKRGATLVANSTKFINNNFGVYTNPAGKGSHAISILGASFETAGNLLPSYSGQTPALLENDKGF
ncbi:MAG: M12 family metallo-peptidase, partial [Saprospiraceae bacterium]